MSLSLPDDYAALKHMFCEFPIEIDIITIIEMFSNRDHIKCDHFKNLKWSGSHMVWGSNTWWVTGLFGTGRSE